jgi:hypothetical protein
VGSFSRITEGNAHCWPAPSRQSAAFRSLLAIRERHGAGTRRVGRKADYEPINRYASNVEPLY